MRLSPRVLLLALLGAIVLVPEPAAAQGILTRARRAVSRGVDRAADNQQRRAEDAVARETDRAMSAAFSEVVNSLGNADGLRLMFKAYPEAAGRAARRLAQQRANAVESALAREVEFCINAGVASVLDGDDSQIGVRLLGGR